MSDVSDAGKAYVVVKNLEEQFSIWLADKALPEGWTVVGAPDTKEACLTWIDANWTDLRPRSVRA